MVKWADYLISAVKYKDEEYIDSVKVHEDLGDKVGVSAVQKRSWVVSKIEGKKKFVTILKDKDTKKWNKGQEVHVVEVNNKKFIRTDKNKKEADNLENLPRF